eukprot:933645-Prorocentrum_minimum.AAC.1
MEDRPIPPGQFRNMTTWAQSEPSRHIGFDRMVDRMVDRVHVDPNVHMSKSDWLICLPWAPGRADVAVMSALLFM